MDPSRCTDSAGFHDCHQPLDVAECLDRFQREARHDAFWTGRYQCPFHVWGEGPTIIFLHGLVDDALSFLLPAARLSQHFQCVLYDQPLGQGDHARLSKYHHADLVADLFALADHLRIDRAGLFGSSFGSTIALPALAQDRRRFPRGVLQGGFACRPIGSGELLLANLARYWPWSMRNLPLRNELLLQANGSDFQRAGPAVWRFYLERSGLPSMQAVAYRALLLHQVDLRNVLPQIGQPVLLICGDHDPLVGKRCEEDLLKGLPHATRAEIENCGHLPQFTHAEILAEITGRFLKGEF